MSILFSKSLPAAPDFYIESPVADMISSRICVFSGWALWDRFPERAELRANGVKIDQVLFSRRPDVETVFGRKLAYGWRCFFETLSLINSLGSVKFELFVDDKLAHQSFHRYVPGRDSIFPLVLFQHIPKTAGSSVRISLETRPDQVSLLSVYNDTPYLPIHLLEGLSQFALDDIDVLFGHFTYGAHCFSHRPYRYLSIMRQPLTQIISYFNFAKFKNKDPAMVGFASLNEALAESKDIAFDNYQTRFIAGHSEDSPVNESHLAQAIENIDSSYEFVGITEEFDRSLIAFSAILGIDMISLRENVNDLGREKFNMAYDTHLVEGATRFDRELYRYVREKFFLGR